jgi:uncharacterized cupin superfamily protein
MAEITIRHDPPRDELDRLGVFAWPTWGSPVEVFPWTYDESETCYILEGHVVVTPDGGDPVEVGQGDLVTFPAGMSCTWDVRQTVRKHYRFG